MEGRRCDSTFRLHVKTIYSLCSNKFSERMRDTSTHGISWQKLGPNARWLLVHSISGTSKCEIRNYCERKWPNVDVTIVMCRIRLGHTWCLPRIRINQSHFFLFYAVRTLQEYTHSQTTDTSIGLMVPGIYTHTTEKVLNAFSNLLDHSQSIHVFWLVLSNNEKMSEIVFFSSILTAASKPPTQ